MNTILTGLKSSGIASHKISSFLYYCEEMGFDFEAIEIDVQNDDPKTSTIYDFVCDELNETKIFYIIKQIMKSKTNQNQEGDQNQEGEQKISVPTLPRANTAPQLYQRSEGQTHASMVVDMDDIKTSPLTNCNIKCVKIKKTKKIKNIWQQRYKKMKSLLKITKKKNKKLKFKLKCITHKFDTVFTHNTKLQNKINKFEKNNECVVCMDCNKCYACIPCGHYIVCHSCKDYINNQCPLCRAKCTFLRIYQ